MKTIAEYDLRGAVAYSYSRFSDPSQGAGHSLERQKEYAPEFCKEYGCKLDPTLHFQDEGKSAFHGKHIAEGGGLGRFLACIKAGRVKAGDVLIVENLDRMSRLPLEHAEDLLKEILQAGVRIHTRSPWSLYDRATLNDPMQRMGMIFEFTRSHRESKYKQERLFRRWQSNRERIKQGEYRLSNLPAWLKAVRKGKSVTGYEIDTERAAVVRSIYQMTIEGNGAFLIAKTLNERGVTTFGRADRWCKSSVTKILHNRAVLGEYQPHSSVRLERKEIESVKRFALGEAIKDHYPAIIDRKTFDAAQVAMEKRTIHKSGAGAAKATNLFPGMIVEARTGRAMQVHDKGYGPQLMIAESSDVLSLPYRILEQAFVAFVDDMPLSMVFPADSGGLEKQIEVARKDVESLKTQVAKIKAKTRESTSDALLELLVERDAELKTKQSELETLERQRGSSATVAASTTKELLTQMQKAKGEKLISMRTKLRNELRYWIKRVNVLPLMLGKARALMADVELTNGKHFQFRACVDLVEWPPELEGRDILQYSKWPKSARKSAWEATSALDRQIIQMDDEGLTLEQMEQRIGLKPSNLSRHLKRLGRGRMKRETLGGDRQMTWVKGACGWQRGFNGRRHYVGCGTLRELYPKLVKDNTEEGTLEAANRWWLEHGGAS